MIINAVICTAPNGDNCKFCKTAGFHKNLCQADEYCKFMMMTHIYISEETQNELKRTAGIRTPEGWKK